MTPPVNRLGTVVVLVWAFVVAACGTPSASSLPSTPRFEPGLVSWGDGPSWSPGRDLVSVSDGGGHYLGLRRDGTLVSNGVLGSPSLAGVEAIASGDEYDLALVRGGLVTAWDRSGFAKDLFPGVHDAIAISSGGDDYLALRASGTVVAWSSHTPGFDYGQSAVPAGLSGVIGIAAGTFHSVALKRDGTVVAWGDPRATSVPVGLSGVKAISAGFSLTLALQRDGTVVAWGDDCCGQTDVPEGLADVRAVSAGNEYAMALKSDGTVVAWGYNRSGQTNVPAGLSHVVGITAGDHTSFAVIGP